MDDEIIGHEEEPLDEDPDLDPEKKKDLIDEDTESLEDLEEEEAEEEEEPFDDITNT